MPSDRRERFGAISLISMRNIVHGALMLVLNFLAVAGLYLG